ncbi:hypothetical protein OG413_39960 [Streptomyces sp. NBC_01433]|uniref:hypothetical protein n=1 Tax=Streptomyces sp. NBC_01433 TaxID=2903864 RepID=UPI0022559085|nr:hypothetical protein [Streptomyces sp. NBC_01433]MCX4681374.1 hypothetical protein [Streptomyces sp. NBC_01433]
MPRLTRQQNAQLDRIEHFLKLSLAELTHDRTVVTMKSGGATTVEFHNELSAEWIAPIRPASLAYLDHAMRAVESMRRDAAPRKAGPQ